MYFFGYWSPVAAVQTAVAVIAHHEVIAFRHDLGAEILETSILGWHELVEERNAVHVDPPAGDPHVIAFTGNDPLHEQLRWIDRVVKHHDVARARLADAVDPFVDDESIVVGECGLHAQSVDPGDLRHERQNERGVHGGRTQRLHPDNDAVLPAGQLARQFRSRVVCRPGVIRERIACHECLATPQKPASGVTCSISQFEPNRYAVNAALERSGHLARLQPVARI